MLILARQEDETIRIGPDVVVKVLEIRGATVRLGIEAPRDVAVMRGEVESKNDTPTDAPPEALAK